MTQNLVNSNISYGRVLSICIVLLLYTTTIEASRRDRVRQKQLELAMLEHDAEASIETNLNIPTMTTPPREDDSAYESMSNSEVESEYASSEDSASLYDDEQEQVVVSAPDVEPEKIELYFENADLSNFAQQVETIFDVTFITDDAFDPLPQGGKSLKGNKISYRTVAPITRTQVWNVFNTFLNIAGLALVPHENERTYRIVSALQPPGLAQKSPLSAHIGTDPSTLPDTNELIRYVYFIENNTVETIKSVVDQFRSTASTALYLNEHKAFILTDISYNIKKLMEIVKELDKVSMPESLSVLKLRRVDAKEVKELYDQLTQKKDAQPFGVPMSRRAPDALALPENVTVIAEPRTNSLILLGPQNARERLEQFIVKNVDVELDQEYSPLRTYQLKYAKADTIAKIMNKVTEFGRDTDAGRSGGVRGGDQYLRPISFVAEPTTNRIVIKGHQEDYLKALDVIKSLDVDQPQVAIEILILAVDIAKTKQLGAQIRSKENANGLLGSNVKFQTSGLFAQGALSPSGIQQRVDTDSPGVQRLLGNLLNTVVGAPAGNTILTLGEDLYGVWGIMQLLETVSNVQLVSNPFLIATNNSPATVELGETRRVTQATALAASGSQQNINALGEDEANLVVNVTPHINSDGMIVLELDITINNFVDPDPSSPTKNTKNLKTFATLANKQVLALGGLVRNLVSSGMSKVPILGDIPLLGWFFKNKSKQEQKQNLLILVSTRIIEPQDSNDLAIYNKKHIDEYRSEVEDFVTIADQKDPIYKMFFKESASSTEKTLDKFLFDRKKNTGSSRIKRLKNRQAQEELFAQQQATELEQKKQAAVRLAQKQPRQAPRSQVASSQKSAEPIKTAKAPEVAKAQPVVTATAKASPAKHAQPVAVSAQTRSQELKSVLRTKKRTNLALTDMLSSHKQGALS